MNGYMLFEDSAEILLEMEVSIGTRTVESASIPEYLGGISRSEPVQYIAVSPDSLAAVAEGLVSTREEVKMALIAGTIVTAHRLYYVLPEPALFSTLVAEQLIYVLLIDRVVVDVADSVMELSVVLLISVWTVIEK